MDLSLTESNNDTQSLLYIRLRPSDPQYVARPHLSTVSLKIHFSNIYYCYFLRFSGLGRDLSEDSPRCQKSKTPFNQI
jgi:hypothetical protein